MKINTSREIKVGALVTLGFLIAFVALFLIGDKEGLFARKTPIYARFMDVEGLTVGAPVRLGGMKVGSVKDIGFSYDVNDKAIIVTMSIESLSIHKMKKDSEASLGSVGLLGDRTVDITIGSRDSEQLRHGDFVNTIEVFRIDDLISESGHAIQDFKMTAKNAREISWKVNYGDGSLAKIINDPRLYISLDSLLIIWSDISEKINRGQGSLAELVNDPDLYLNLTGFLDQLSQFMTDINVGEGSLAKLARNGEIYDHTDSLIVALNSTLEKINSGEGTLGQVINNQELYRKLYSTLESFDSLAADIRENPKRYVKLSIF